MKIIFFGSSEFSLEVLKHIVASGHHLSAVACSLDKPSGRGKHIAFCPVKKYALDNDIAMLQYKSISKEGEESLKAFAPDVIITASFGQILRQNIIDIPKYGVVNVHASLLPAYRGAAPIQWAIINGEKTTGVTIMQTDAGIDTGDTFFARQIAISEQDTCDTMFAKLATLGGECIVEFLNNFDKYYLNKTKQDDSKSNYAPMIKGDMSQIKFDNSAENIVNFVRGNCSCSPAYFYILDAVYRVFEAKALPKYCTAPAGTVVCANSKSGLIIACGDGAVEIIQLQVAGKARMRAKDYLNGKSIEVGSVAK